ncbi:hypothetical protein [Cupriavidus sp. IDO]|uniref:hypothetical protein n=1 Tax=Cupriavidus sp. IDO TaxID=1539142 RepID=UPI000579067F|nr:hypothetical protein [Cupriavidus sp. IDO]KWR89917.1 hypothetical protein RM96_12005 [Cupriavidus sp. IDO]
MTNTSPLKKIAAAVALSLAALGAAQAGTLPADKYGYDFRSGVPADQYGYQFRSTVPGDKYGYEFRTYDAFTDGARAGNPAPLAEGFGKVAGLDKVGVSAEPARSFDPYLDGARA